MDQHEELSEWERLIPSEWLCAPHFRKDQPDWIEEVQGIISKGLRAKKRENIILPPNQIFHLECILATYIKAHADWQGWLNKSDLVSCT